MQGNIDKDDHTEMLTEEPVIQMHQQLFLSAFHTSDLTSKVVSNAAFSQSS